MRLCIDIDGTLCTLRTPEQHYRDVTPLPGAAERLRAWRAAGHYVILATARHMKTCDGNVGLVVARQGATLLEWLERHGFEYDEIWFGKPHADCYVDDKAVHFGGDWTALRVPGADTATGDAPTAGASAAGLAPAAPGEPA